MHAAYELIVSSNHATWYLEAQRALIHPYSIRVDPLRGRALLIVIFFFNHKTRTETFFIGKKEGSSSGDPTASLRNVRVHASRLS